MAIISWIVFYTNWFATDDSARCCPAGQLEISELNGMTTA